MNNGTNATLTTTDNVVRDGLYVFGIVDEIIVWCPLFQHPDQPSSWYVVPADCCPLAGISDLRTDDEDDWPHGGFTFRGNLGTWMPAELICSGRSTGQLGRPAATRLRELVSAMAAGRPGPADRQDDDEDDPGYGVQLTKVREELETLLSR